MNDSRRHSQGDSLNRIQANNVNSGRQSPESVGETDTNSSTLAGGQRTVKQILQILYHIDTPY